MRTPDERFVHNSTIPRHTRLASKKSARMRATKIRPRSAKQAAREMDQFGPHADHVRGKPCDLCGRRPRNSAHHAITRARLGLAWDLTALCGSGTTGCHGDVENPPKSWTSERIAEVKAFLSERAAQHWQSSPFRHLYCEACGRYRGKRACRYRRCDAGLRGDV